MHVLIHFQKSIVQYFNSIFFIACIAHTNGSHRPIEPLIKKFLGLAVVVNASVNQLNIGR